MIDIENLPKEEHYEIPEGYFDTLPKQILGTIHKEQTKRRRLWISSIAAVMVAIICTTLVLQFNNDNNSKGEEVVEMREEPNLEDQVIDYYNNEFAQMDYYNY